MKKLKLTFLLLSIIFSIRSAAYPVEVISVQELEDSIFLFERLKYIEDENHTWDIDMVADFPDSIFQTTDSSTIYPGNKKVWWLKFTVANTSNDPIVAFLFHNRTHYTKVFFKNRTWESKNIGSFSLPQNRNGFTLKEFARLSFLPNDTVDIYIQLQHVSTLDKAPVFLLYNETKGYQKAYNILDSRVGFFNWYGVFLGVVFFFSLFSFLQYFQHRDKIYLFYALYLFSVFFSYMWRAGKHFVTPFTPLMSCCYDFLNSILFFICAIAYLMLFKSFLDENKKEERYYRNVLSFVIKLVLLFIAIDVGIKYFEFPLFGNWFYRISLISLAITFLYIIWYSFRLRFSAYHYLMMGNLVIVLFGIVVLVKDNWLGFPVIKFWTIDLSPLQAGVLCEILFFSLAVGQRTKSIMEERKNARQIIDMTKQENQDLKQQLVDAQKIQMGTEDFIDSRLVLPIRNGYEFLEKENIIHCNADDNYCKIYLNDGKSILVSKTLKEVENLLNKSYFLRIHNSHLVNLKSIKNYVKGNGGHVILIDGKEVPVAKGKKDALLKKLQLK